jgi:hypothetical protein
MPPKALKAESLSPGHWDRIPPPVDQELWIRYMNEDDSDRDASDTEEGEMAGPSSASKPTKPEALEGKPKPKNDLVSDSRLSSSRERAIRPEIHMANTVNRSRKYWTMHSTTRSARS